MILNHHFKTILVTRSAVSTLASSTWLKFQVTFLQLGYELRCFQRFVHYFLYTCQLFFYVGLYFAHLILHNVISFFIWGFSHRNDLFQHFLEFLFFFFLSKFFLGIYETCQGAAAACVVFPIWSNSIPRSISNCHISLKIPIASRCCRWVLKSTELVIQAFTAAYFVSFIVPGRLLTVLMSCEGSWHALDACIRLMLKNRV